MRKESERPEITASFFGDQNIRFVDLLKDKVRRSKDELFFTIEGRGEKGNFPSDKKQYGYMKLTDGLKEFIKKYFITGCEGVSFIEWKDCYNVVFDERSIIGGISYSMSFEEFNKLFPAA